MNRPRNAVAPAPGLVLVLVLVLGTAAAGEPEPLEPGASLARRGLIAEALKDGEKVLVVTVGKELTAVLDLGAKFEMRVDRLATVGKEGDSLLKPGAKVAALGRKVRMTNAPGAMARDRIWPCNVVVVGEGFEPTEVRPSARRKWKGELDWFREPVDRFEPGEGAWVGLAGDLLVPLAPADKVLATAVHSSAAFLEKDRWKAATKGRPVRFSGKIAQVRAPAKKGEKPEVRVTPARLVLLEPGFAYELVETEGS